MARPSLLIVDDEETIVFALRDFFQRTCEVSSASRLDEVENALERGAKWDFVVTDLQLSFGGREGLAVVEQVHRSCQTTVIVLFTAYETPEIRVEALRLGARAIFSKPFPLPELANLLTTLSEVPK